MKWCGTLLLLLTMGMAPAPSVKVVVVGIAQDGGIPQIGCRQKICLTQHHFVSSLILQTSKSIYLIDATPDLREQYFELTKRFPQVARKNLFDGIFLTHAHMGHYSGLLYLGKESISTQKVPVHCSNEMTDYLRNNAPWSLLVTNANIELHPFHTGEEIQFDGFSVRPLAVPHRREFTDTHGFLIRGAKKSLLYIPDIDAWEPVRDSLIRWLNESDYALLDGTFFSGDELPGRNMSLVPHPTIEHSISFLQSLPLFNCKTYFTHLNHTNLLLDRESKAAKEFAKTPYQIASEWQQFEL